MFNKQTNKQTKKQNALNVAMRMPS